MAACPMTALGVPMYEGLKRRKMDSESPTNAHVDGSNHSSEEVKFQFLNDQICHLQRENEPLNRDDLNYSQAWFTHYRRREQFFKPWNPTLGPITNPWEALRIQAIQVYWRATKTYRISPITIHLAVWIMNKVLSVFARRSEMNFTRDVFAAVIAVSFRAALKFEERPEALWSIRRIWEALPLFDNWSIDRAEQYLMRIEAEALKIVDDCLDVPLALQFFDKYIMVGGWPPELVKEYTSLGHFLLALSTFTSGDGHPLSHITPSKLAAATVVLSVKIVNTDTRRSYEFFPARFAAFCQMSLKELQPAIKGLSHMLRRKPNEASILGRIYPEWGEHEWM